MSAEDYLMEALNQGYWKEEVKIMCRDYIRSRHPAVPTVDEIKMVIGPQARSKVPTAVKSELVRRVYQEFSQNPMAGGIDSATD